MLVLVIGVRSVSVIGRNRVRPFALHVAVRMRVGMHVDVLMLGAVGVPVPVGMDVLVPQRRVGMLVLVAVGAFVRMREPAVVVSLARLVAVRVDVRVRVRMLVLRAVGVPVPVRVLVLVRVRLARFVIVPVPVMRVVRVVVGHLPLLPTPGSVHGNESVEHTLAGNEMCSRFAHMQIPRGDERRQNFIGGQWIGPSTEKYEPCTNPADTREVLGHFPRSGAADAKAAVDAAAGAFAAWAATPGPERGRIIGRAHAILKANVDLMAEALCREEGKVLGEAKGEIIKGLNLLEFYAGEGFRTHGKTVPSESRSTLAMTLRQPVGPVALITPWNFPFAIPVWKTAPALVAGCTAVLKPASLTPVCTHLFAEALAEAGLPRGVLNVVTGPGGAVGDALVDDPRIKAVSFTGSNEVGIRLYQKAAARGVKVTCEMGGKNAVVVLDDADLDLAAEGIIQGAFGSTGQRCTATSRVVTTPKVARGLTEALVEKARNLRVGNGMSPGVQMGPAVDQSQLKTNLDAIEAARFDGARLLCGGERLGGDEHARGFFVAPTVFDGVQPGSRLARDEVFGPVLAIQAAKDIDEAIRLANDVAYGLTASIYTRDYFAAMRFVESAEVGMVHVNQPTVGGEAQLPFGGIKATGVGEKEMAEEGSNFFTVLKTVWLDYTGARRTTNIY